MNILIVDDEPGTRTLVAAAVERLGHRATQAADAHEAWPLFESERPEVVITDWAMPGMDGTELARRIRADTDPAYTFVMILTGKADEGAAREAMEEANARVEITDLYTVYSIPHISQVYMMFRARLLDPAVSPGSESLEVHLAREDEIPWDQLAFAMVKRSLEHFIEDRKSGVFLPRFGDIRPPQR